MTDRWLAPEAREMTVLDFGSESRSCLGCVGGCPHAHVIPGIEQGTRPKVLASFHDLRRAKLLLISVKIIFWE